jgi:hypothetical protein
VCLITPLVGSVDSPHVLVACSFASVGFFGNNESSSLKATKTNHIISGTVSTITGIHSKIVTQMNQTMVNMSTTMSLTAIAKRLMMKQGIALMLLDRNYTAMRTHMQQSVHLSALLIT